MINGEKFDDCEGQWSHFFQHKVQCAIFLTALNNKRFSKKTSNRYTLGDKNMVMNGDER